MCFYKTIVEQTVTIEWYNESNEKMGQFPSLAFSINALQARAKEIYGLIFTLRGDHNKKENVSTLHVSKK